MSKETNRARAERIANQYGWDGHDETLAVKCLLQMAEEVQRETIEQLVHRFQRFAPAHEMSVAAILNEIRALLPAEKEPVK